jgi:hypothetical protein
MNRNQDNHQDRGRINSETLLEMAVVVLPSLVLCAVIALALALTH